MQTSKEELHLLQMVKRYLRGMPGLSDGGGPRHLIPHIIHQAWKSYLVPKATVPWIKSWAESHPQWEYWFWTPDNVKAFLHRHYPHLLDVYVNLPFDVQRADAMRYIVLYHFGGLYADLDMECLKPVDFWSDRFSCVFSEEPHLHNLLYPDAKRNVLNSFLLCRPGHPLYKDLMTGVEELSHKAMVNNFNDIIRTTGPFFVQDRLQKYLTAEDVQRKGNDVTIVHPDYFLPTFDEKQRGYLEYLCSKNESASANRDFVHVHKVCQRFVRNQFSNIPRDVSFSNHYWYHTWFSEESWRNKSIEPIHQIVPNVRTFK